MTEPLDQASGSSQAGKRELLTRLLRAKAGRPAIVGTAAAASSGSPSVVPDSASWFEPFPLSDLQQAYLFGRSDEVELGNNSIHVYAEFESGDLEVGRLDRSFHQVLERHGMMRSIIQPDGRQRILREVPDYHIAVDDLRAVDAPAAEALVARHRERMSHQLFPVGKWPMFEIRVCLLPTGRISLHFSMDAMGVDAPSFVLLFKDWGALYRDPAEGLPPLEISYRDYVLAEQAFRASPGARSSRDYWMSRLPGLPPAPQLPLAIDPSVLALPRFVRRSAGLDVTRWRQLKARGHQAGLTPSMVLGAAFAEVLGRWSRSPRFCTNFAVINRLAIHPQIQNVLGVFSDLVLLEVDAGAGETFEERARRIHEQLWTDLDHRHFGGIRLLRELARRDGTLKARMPVVFTATLLDFSLLEWLGESKVFVTQTPQVWLDHQIFERAGALAFHWDAVDALFPGGMLDDMFASYCRLLDRLADGEEAWIERGRLPLPPAQAEVRAVVNGAARSLPNMPCHRLFEQQAARSPERPAVVASDRSLTYGELDRLAESLARRLRVGGAGPDTLVALVLEKGWRQVVAVLATVKAGAAYLPIDPAVPAERLAYLLDHGRARWVFTEEKFAAHRSWPPGVELLAVEDEGDPPAGEAIHPAPPIDLDHLAYVIYTSGSTGAPKGVMVPHRGLLNSVLETNSRFGVGPEDRVLALAPLHHDLSVYDIFGALAAGAAVILPEPTGTRDPAHWVDLIRRHRVTLWNSVPAMMEMLLEQVVHRDEAIPSSLRLALLGGDWIPVSLPGRLRALAPGLRLVSTGGPTETTIWNILHEVVEANEAARSIPYGRPIRNVRYHILDSLLDDCPAWVQGEIYCSGVGIARGYWRDPQQTASRFTVHPRTGERLYRTGDLGRYLPGGDIEFLGREDFQVKIHGVRIELGEIEAALLRHPDIREAAVAAPVDAHGRRRLAAFVVPHAGRTLDETELRAFLGLRLPEAMLPSSITRLAGLPLSANGKVDRRALPALAAPAAAAPETSASSGSPLLARIGRLVGDVLERTAVDPDVDLLEIGASSIDMVRIANLLETEIGYRPGVSEIFLLSTVRGLAGACEKQLSRRSAEVPVGATAPPGEGGTPRLLLHPQERYEFRRRQLGVRGLPPDRDSIGLPHRASLAELQELFARRSSRRDFLADPLPLSELAELLGLLRQIPGAGRPKYRYPSGGGLYPVQTYVWCRPGRVEGLAGSYYYHPVAHRLVPLSSTLAIDRSLHTTINRRLFDGSAFSLFLVADLKAIAPMYGEYSVQFATLEAGYMGQLLMTSAPPNIGLCPLGGVAFETLRSGFVLDESHVLVHSLVGGRIDPERAPLTAGAEGMAGDDLDHLDDLDEADAATRPESGIPRVARDRPLPLSFAQQRLWFLDQMDRGSPLYNRAGSVRIEGALDDALLERCLGEIVKRHEMLRTRFLAVDGEPFQIADLQERPVLSRDDLTGLSPEARAERVRTSAVEEARTRFDLGRGPLARFRLLRVGTTEHYLLITVHHIAGDGWSFGVFLREIARIYEAFAAGRPNPLAELPVQYADFAAWQRRWAAGANFETHLAYWRQRFAGAPPLLQLPADRPRPAVLSGRGAQHRQSLPGDLVRRLEELSRTEGVTLYTTLLAAFDALVARLTGRHDVVVGTPVANRQRTEVEGLIGFFVNAVVLRTDLAGNPTFREVLRRVGETVLGAYAHQELPFEKVVEDLGVERSLGHTPLFQVWFVFQNTPGASADFGGLRISHEEIDDGTAKFDLQVAIEPSEGGLRVSWSYSTELFEAARIARMAEAYQALLSDAAVRPAARLSELEWVGEEERKRQAMEKGERQDSAAKTLRFARRKAVDVAAVELVRSGLLEPGSNLPLLIVPASGDIDLVDWAREHRGRLGEDLARHGGILFRGFNVASVEEFERFAQAICPELFGEYGDLPREQVGGKVYSSTPYPQDKAILFHNESSQMDRWPLKQWFFCVTPADKGGETPIADCRKVYELIPTAVRERFARLGVTYVRNFTEGLDVPWQEFFRTTDRAEAEAACRRAGIEPEWQGSRLRTRKRAPAVIAHPKTKEMLFFNQIQAHHVSCLDPETRASLISLFGEEGLPRNVYFGDGSPIEDDVMAEIIEIYSRVAVQFAWERHDLLMLDNMLTAHSRNPFRGARKIAVVMGEMVENPQA